MTKPTSIAVDLAKIVFEITATDERERVLFRRRFSRSRFREVLTWQPPATVVMEACGSAYYWARTAAQFRHQPVLLPPAYDKPFLLKNETDRTAATGLLQARRRPGFKETAAARGLSIFGESVSKLTVPFILFLHSTFSRGGPNLKTLMAYLLQYMVYVDHLLKFPAHKLAIRVHIRFRVLFPMGL
jgi:hypothetical protein